MLAVSRVDVDQHQADVVAGVLHHGPLPAVGGPNADTISWTVALTDESAGQTQNSVVETLKGKGDIRVDVNDGVARREFLHNRTQVLTESLIAKWSGTLLDTGAEHVAHLVAIGIDNILAVWCRHSGEALRQLRRISSALFCVVLQCRGHGEISLV